MANNDLYDSYIFFQVFVGIVFVLMIVAKILDNKDKWQFMIIPIIEMRIMLIGALVVIWIYDDSHTFLFTIEILLLLVLRLIAFKTKKDLGKSSTN